MVPFLVALSVALAATGAAIPLLRRAQVLDVPYARSTHREVLPRGGGLALLLGLIYVPPLARVFGLAPLEPIHWMILAAFAPALLLLEEARKAALSLRGK